MLLRNCHLWKMSIYSLSYSTRMDKSLYSTNVTVLSV